jgi:excisionase family DNA binding protein
MELKDVKKPTLYNSKEVAAFIGVSRATLQRIIESGKIRAINISDSKKPQYRFLAEDVQNYYDSQIQNTDIKKSETVDEQNLRGDTLQDETPA